MGQSTPENSLPNQDWQATLKSSVDSVRETLQPIATSIHDNRDQLYAIYLSIVPSIEELTHSYAGTHMRFDRASLEKLMSHGWYLNPDLPLALQEYLIEALAKDSDDALDVIADQIESTVDDIHASLTSRFPDRSEIFDDAFCAHQNELYNLSVLAFLTQADGMWRDILGRNLFHQGGPSVAAKELQNQVSEQWLLSILIALETASPLWLTESNRGPSFGELNRHQVLHGEVWDYGTKENSLKAISFLSFVAFVLKAVDD